ncbi:hypothetical protein PN476_10485, partial [Dolichospermum circinale CS-537/05]|nr:hypothetical protein [Dolichospermum circinale CS-537/05]
MSILGSTCKNLTPIWLRHAGYQQDPIFLYQPKLQVLISLNYQYTFATSVNKHSPFPAQISSHSIG